jgi:hypothetical protein
MKKNFIILLILCAFIIGQAQTRRSAKRPTIELGPKASMYLGSLRFGIGAEFLVNPLRNLGLRFNLAELSFGDGDTRFAFNLRDISMDGLIYIPMEGIKPYAFLGLGMAADEDRTRVEFRGGLGFNYSVTRSTDIFVEPGAIITYSSYGEGTTDIWFRLSIGGRFGLIR